jgi:4'-phosphopantetheinyl transferase
MKWQLPPAQIQMQLPEVHLWRVSLNQPIEVVHSLAPLLSPDEQQRADRFRRDQDRQHFIVGRAMLRQILGRYLEISPAALQFGYEPRGKPFLVNAPDLQAPDLQALSLQAPGLRFSDLQFNVSHSHELALYAIGRDRRVGVDLEYLSRTLSEVEPLAQRFFAAREYADLMALPAEQRRSAFLRLWTCKEAVLKAIGTGLGGLEQIEIPQSSAPEFQLTTGVGKTIAHWSILQLASDLITPDLDYVGALAIEGDSWQLCCWQGLSIELGD